MRLRPVAAAAVAVSCLTLIGCAPDSTGTVTFRLVRAETTVSGLRDNHIGLDRERVDSALCQVFDGAGVELSGGKVAVDPDVAPGEQEVRLGDIPAGEGYFARIAGLDEAGAVVECGWTGPFRLGAGQQAAVTVFIVTPPVGDPECLARCAASADCSAGHYCPSPCARGFADVECTNALCARQMVGEPCLTSADCGPLTCLPESVGYPGGFCSGACADDATCPDGTLCRLDGGLERRVCVPRCQEDVDCRESYRCAEVSGAERGCVP